MSAHKPSPFFPKVHIILLDECTYKQARNVYQALLLHQALCREDRRTLPLEQICCNLLFFEVGCRPSMEPHARFEFRTLRSRPELNSRIGSLTNQATQAPPCFCWNCVKHIECREHWHLFYVGSSHTRTHLWPCDHTFLGLLVSKWTLSKAYHWPHHHPTMIPATPVISITPQIISSGLYLSAKLQNHLSNSLLVSIPTSMYHKRLKFN